MAQFLAGEQSSFQVIFDLIYGAINYKSKPPPLTKEDVLRGLIFAYYSPQVRPHQDRCPPFNLHFHYFASSLYALGVIDDPVLCVFAMRDALETSWDNAQQHDRLLNSVGHWIISGGFKIIWQIKNGYEAVAPQTTLEHGELYELELDNTYGDCHPAPGLTMHRWQFWQQRIKDTMIFLVECERGPELRGNENIARQISAHMDMLAGQPNS
ncbi:hypothetical protein Daesc_007751 [Daldinia eschscholtzii]|uniref:Uncharacterized protein n=1 Tax=Daldinia eschscholtzii TaxID=292717 RepID=A0AAX6MEY7_9PEZI